MRRRNESKLQEVHAFISYSHAKEGRSPTMREIAAACDIASTAWVSKLVHELEEQGLVTFQPRGKYQEIALPPNLARTSSIRASIIGDCPCGEPILAVENVVATVSLPTEIFGTEEHFILKAHGNSMIKRGIFDGDLMVVRAQNTADVGEVVIARVNGEEATAKILALKQGKYYLKPANDKIDETGKRVYQDIHPEGEWEILGVVDRVIHEPIKNVL